MSGSLCSVSLLPGAPASRLTFSVSFGWGRTISELLLAFEVFDLEFDYGRMSVLCPEELRACCYTCSKLLEAPG